MGWGGGVCKVIFVSNPTFVELCYVVLELFWGWDWGFDNKLKDLQVLCQENGLKFKGKRKA